MQSILDAANKYKILFILLLFCAAFGMAKGEPTKIQIGMYVVDVAHLDIKESEFFADFYIWYKAPQNASWAPDSIEFMNGKIENATVPTISIDASGNKMWSQRLKGQFRGHFLLHPYPFDAQILPINIEDSEQQVDKIVFMPSLESGKNYDSWLEPEMNVPDWKKNGAECSVDVHEYQTDFGVGKAQTSRYSRLTFNLHLQRLFMPHLIKFILPLIIIAGMAYMVFYINASEFETQCAICVTALLSAVALHISQADALPAVGYLVMSDKIFILFYLVIFSALVQTVIKNNYAKKRRFDVAIYLDKIFRVWYVVILIAGNMLVFFLR